MNTFEHPHNPEKPQRNEVVASTSDATVVARFEFKADNESSYQSEAQLEEEFIKLLEGQAYERLRITTEADMLINLRKQLEKLNRVQFTDSEWNEVLTKHLCRTGETWQDKTRRVHEDHIFTFTFEDGTARNLNIIDKRNIHNNTLQVINQYEINRGEGGAKQSNRYDVTVLVNGLPMVHIELKRRGVELKEAFNQIKRYDRESFWAGSGLFDYVQLFVISNGTLTKYYSNSVRSQHINQQNGVRRSKAANSYEFTSWWADANNRRINDLISFGKTFFAKHSLLNILTRYCVLTVDRVLLVMRPYQIVATERIIDQIRIAQNYKTLGTIEAGGYIWHTTGSGKTLTSFKTAQLATQLPGVDKVLFVVDRQDLDYQTMREYNKFQEGAANSNNSTAVLTRQLEDPEARIIITTIQKLSNFIAGNASHPVFRKHVVIIFDECHRSQFGDMHKAITKAFKQYNLFGFTGTPIFDMGYSPTNATVTRQSSRNRAVQTTGDTFGKRLHTYTIVDAIEDKNVLPFRIDYVDTVQVGEVTDSQVSAIDKERALLAPQRIEKIVEYILENYASKTRRTDSYSHKQVQNVAEVTRKRNRQEAITSTAQVHGFNSLMATASVEAAKAYYAEFKRQQADLPEQQRLKVALIYSFAPNEASGGIDEEGFDATHINNLDTSSRDFLEAAIEDYNHMFASSYDTSGDNFGNYYRDLSQRMKNREVDITIVVNMFLTGFDATTMNTLWVDKNLRAHGLIQAYSRTNRILNSVKAYGNIVCFRDLQEATNDAIEMFGNSERSDAGRVIVLPPFSELYANYAQLVEELLQTFPLGEPMVGEAAKEAFAKLYGQVLRARNLIESHDEFVGNEILSAREHQDYQSIYLEIYEQRRALTEAEAADIVDDLQFEIALIQQVEVNVDYILMLIEKYQQSAGQTTEQVKEDRDQITRAIESSPSLRNKRDLIEDFVDGVSINTKVTEEWNAYVEAAFQREVQQLIAVERLQEESTLRFIRDGFQAGQLDFSGQRFANLLPPMSRFSRSSGEPRAVKKQRVMVALQALFDRFKGLAGNVGD